MRLRSQGDTYADPFEGVPEVEICLEDVPGLSIAPGNSGDEDEDIIID